MTYALFTDQEGKAEGELYPISSKEKVFDEAWLQKLLISSPNLLSIKEIGANLDNLIPLGREVSVTAGSIDNLYITSEGLICLVETKLWRNPEAHRTVLAQIIDYAKDLANMSFDEFQKSVEKSQLNGERPSFWERVSKYVKVVDQIDFQSKVQESLSAGRFLLLIVGDKIYPEVAMLFETIQSAPNLEFKLGLIEIQTFKTSKEKIWPLLVIPKLVGKTHEVVRSVVKIIYEEKRPEVEADTIEVQDQANAKIDEKTFKSSVPKEFADLFIPILEGWISDKFIIYWGFTGFSVWFFWKGKNRSIIDVYPTYISLMTEDMMKKRGFPLEPYHEYRKAIDNIPIVRRLFSESRRYVYYKDIPLQDFKILIEATDKMARDFKKFEKTG